MTAGTAENTTDMQTKQLLDDGYILDVPVGDAVTIYKNTFVGLDATGYLESYVAYAQAATPTGNRFWGIALENVDNSAGANAAKSCRVQVAGVLQYPFASVAVGDVGKPVYVTDNATLSLQANNNAFLGTILSVPATGTAVVDMLSPTARTFADGRVVHKTINIDMANAVNDEMILLHETENHNGAYVYSLRSINTEVITATTPGVLTVVHTRGTDTTTTAIITTVDNSADQDVTQGTGGIMEIAVDNVAMILIPADVAAIAKVTTVAAEGGSETGQFLVHCGFLLL